MWNFFIFFYYLCLLLVLLIINHCLALKKMLNFFLFNCWSFFWSGNIWKYFISHRPTWQEGDYSSPQIWIPPYYTTTKRPNLKMKRNSLSKQLVATLLAQTDPQLKSSFDLSNFVLLPTNMFWFRFLSAVVL